MHLIHSYQFGSTNWNEQWTMNRSLCWKCEKALYDFLYWKLMTFKLTYIYIYNCLDYFDIYMYIYIRLARKQKKKIKSIYLTQNSRIYIYIYICVLFFPFGSGCLFGHCCIHTYCGSMNFDLCQTKYQIVIVIHTRKWIIWRYDGATYKWDMDTRIVYTTTIIWKYLISK